MQAEITYTRDTGEKLVNETFGPNNIRRRTTGLEEPHRVEIADGHRGLRRFLNRKMPVVWPSLKCTPTP